jgi:hypothetical protein
LAGDCLLVSFAINPGSRAGYAKAQVRAKVEHPFRVIKHRYTKVRFRGLAKGIVH